VPPVEPEYQSAVSPVPTVTVKAGIVSSAQMVWSPPLLGAGGLGWIVRVTAVRVVLVQPVVVFLASA
jgi:hypothetical protein